ncbi:MAG TPA: ABC-F family ATP-binding cassette domain-containing protein [Candidatus Sulfopaludibacter sp.]|jgi:ATP-binding cassette subfamily F protein uup|nr:ABC-F family ATP-binding cassette domain-containing protein [Candidatus Sulfopaludibacter sp.]
MALIESCSDLSKSFGSRQLFTGISLGISEGERLGLIGPNGSGKSTLLKILCGRLEPDSGSISVRRNTRVGYVAQDAEFEPGHTAAEVIAEAIAGESLDELEHAARINQTLGRAGFSDGSVLTETLSGGWRRRLAIARELARQPDLLFLDEPTNHLDLDGILWLEKLLATSSFASVVVSHDRYFLDNVVNDMAEIDRVYPEGIFRVEGSYSHFLERKAEFLLAQTSRQDSLANKVRREVEWLRRGAKARTGKSKARIDEAGRMMRELGDLETRSAKGVTQIDFTATERRTKRLVSVENVTKSLGGRTLLRDLSFTLTPGTRLGLLGLNGTGKTTLLRMLAGELLPDSGVIQTADALRTVYFDQAREQLDLSQTLRHGLGAHGDTVIFQDRPIHVAGWARRFLFDSGQLDRPLASLSGGEQARVLIARLMLQPADLLLMDEPTNDLDIPTLEVLEDSLTEFPGALVLVTHDRYLLDRVSTAVLGLDGQGDTVMYADYWQWEQAQFAPKPKAEKAAPPPAAKSGKKKLSYLEAREWEQMEARILEAEEAADAIRAEMHSPEVVSDGPRLQACYLRLQEAEGRIAALYERWAELESVIGSKDAR